MTPVSCSCGERTSMRMNGFRSGEGPFSKPARNCATVRTYEWWAKTARSAIKPSVRVNAAPSKRVRYMIHLRAKNAVHTHLHHLKSWGSRRSRIGLLAVMLVTVALCGCSEGVRLVQSGESGGIVIYPFKESGSLLSPFRRDALQMMQQHWGGSYRLVGEGESEARRPSNEHPGSKARWREPE